MAKRKAEEVQDERVMVVTGASSGLGAHLVRHFAAKQEGNWKIAAIARGQEKLKATCAAAGNSAKAFPCDISNKDQAKSTVEAVLKDFGKIDGQLILTIESRVET